MDDLPDGLHEFLAWRTRMRPTEAPTPGERAQDVYSRLIKDVVSPALRAQGLRGSGGRYSLGSETHWALLGFQKSAYSDRSDVRFTVNLLVVRRDAWDELVRESPYYGKKPSAGMSYPDPVAEARIGQLVSESGDKWWRLFRGQDMAAVEADLLGDLTNAGVPWLRQTIAESSD